MELGKFIHDPDQIKKLGLVTDLSTDLNSGLAMASSLLHSYESVPPIARRDAKMKGRQIILDQMNEDAIKGVVESISGQEFQTTARNLLAKK